jgi:hypothetical protein
MMVCENVAPPNPISDSSQIAILSFSVYNVCPNLFALKIIGKYSMGSI